jgi:hypothetical protein
MRTAARDNGMGWPVSGARKSARRWVAASLCALSLAGTAGALAQDANKPQAELQLTVKPAVSPDEQAAQADAIARRGNDLAQRLTKMLGEARRDKDIMRANCVNRKLTEVNANVRNVDGRVNQLKDFLKAGDKDRGGHEYTVLTVLSQKFDVLDQEAAQCLGQSVFEPGASQVVTTVPNAVNVLVDPSVTPAPAAPPPAVSIPAATSGTT